MSCLMVQDFVRFIQALENKLKNHPLTNLLIPILTMMDSVREGTRIGLGNEIHILMEFAGFF
jgi:hypothetical protein